jgi:aminobenzoyl-glutamate transport protein
MSADAAAADSGAGTVKKGGMLDRIERIGNKVPHPAVIFLGLCVLVIVMSAVLSWIGVSASYEQAAPIPAPAVHTYDGGTDAVGTGLPPTAAYDQDFHMVHVTTKVTSLLTGDGLRFIFTNMTHNFNDFGVVATILVAMVGVGVAERAGLVGALIRKLVKVAPPGALTFIIVLIGILSSVASDAGYLVLIPLAAVAFRSVGRNPLAGIAAGFAGVSAAFGVNILITPVDGLITEITNESIGLVQGGHPINLTANLYFSIASTLFMAVVITLVTERLVEPRLGKFTGAVVDDEVEADEIDPAAESRGLRLALYGLIGVAVAVVPLALIPGAPLRNPTTGSLLEDSPFMSSLIVLIMVAFLVMGLCYGRGANTLRGSAAVVGAIEKTFAGLAGLIFLLLIIAQFIAYFNYSKIATVTAVNLADALEKANIGALWLLIGFILVTIVINILIPGVVPKWAILAPIFVPLFIRLGVAPQTVLAAYRIGDSPTNVVTPLMVYLPFIVLLTQKYKKDSGVGTVISLMIPYTVVVAVTWILFFIAWYLLHIPLGPGAGVHN